MSKKFKYKIISSLGYWYLWPNVFSFTAFLLPVIVRTNRLFDNFEKLSTLFGSSGDILEGWARVCCVHVFLVPLRTTTLVGISKGYFGGGCSWCYSSNQHHENILVFPVDRDLVWLPRLFLQSMQSRSKIMVMYDKTIATTTWYMVQNV